MGDWAGRLRALEKLLDGAGWAVAALVLCACLYIVGSTIRLGVFARRDEIEIWKLVGATDRFVKTPFLVEGGLQGALGTRSRPASCTGSIGWPRRGSKRCSAAGSPPVRSASSRRRSSALASCSGTLLGLCGSALALGRYVEG